MNENLIESQKQEHKCKCNGKRHTLIYLENGDPFIIELGKHLASEIKMRLGIPELETLTETFDGEHRMPKRYQDGDMVHIEGCETFYGAPTCASNSHPEMAIELFDAPFKGVIGIEPQLTMEAGSYLLIFLKVPLGDRDVDILLEWPFKNRLLFSEKITTPKNPQANWGYPDLMIGGRKWQGLSLRTTETTPYKTLLACLGKILW